MGLWHPLASELCFADPQEDEYAMRRVRIAFIATLLAAGAVVSAGVAAAEVPLASEPGGGICGAWEPRGGAGDGYQRLCIDGNLTWYEYR